MKKTLILTAILLFAGCGTTPGPVGPPGPPGPGPIPIPTPVPPPPPPPVMTFEIAGKKIGIKAQMKVNAKVSLEEMRASLLATVAQLENDLQAP